MWVCKPLVKEWASVEPRLTAITPPPIQPEPAKIQAIATQIAAAANLRTAQIKRAHGSCIGCPHRVEPDGRNSLFDKKTPLACELQESLSCIQVSRASKPIRFRDQRSSPVQSVALDRRERQARPIDSINFLRSWRCLRFALRAEAFGTSYARRASCVTGQRQPPGRSEHGVIGRQRLPLPVPAVRRYEMSDTRSLLSGRLSSVAPSETVPCPPVQGSRNRLPVMTTALPVATREPGRAWS